MSHWPDFGCPPELRHSAPLGSLLRIVRARSENEIRCLAAFGGKTLAAASSGFDHPADATSTIGVEAWIDRARWRGRFTIDERVPEVREVEFVRLPG